MGSNLAIALSNLGARVLIIDSMIDGLGGNMFNVKNILNNVRIETKDLRDADAIASDLNDADFVFHFAGQGSHAKADIEPEFDMELNVRSTLRLLEVIRRSRSSPRLIFAGTRGQIGRANEKVDETYAEFPLSVYGADKSAAEKYCLIYAHRYGINAISLRFTNTYGPRHQMKSSQMGVLNWFIRLALEGRTIELWDGSQKRDFLYVDDATDAALKAGAAASSIRSDYCYVCSGGAMTLAEVADEVIRLAGSGKAVKVPYPANQQPSEVGDVLISNAKARSLLGWGPQTALSEGLARTIAFYRQNLKEYV